MRSLPILLAAPLLAAGPASAHIGHLATAAAHDHWTLAAGLVTITGAALVAWLKGGREEAEAEADPEPDTQTDEEAA